MEAFVNRKIIFQGNAATNMREREQKMKRSGIPALPGAYFLFWRNMSLSGEA